MEMYGRTPVQRTGPRPDPRRDPALLRRRGHCPTCRSTDIEEIRWSMTTTPVAYWNADGSVARRRGRAETHWRDSREGGFRCADCHAQFEKPVIVEAP